MLQGDGFTIPPSETECKSDKLRRFAGICSRVTDHVFLGSDVVARSLETLRTHAITHVLNAAGVACAEYHASKSVLPLTYKTLHLYDSPAEDLTPFLYDAVEFIESAVATGGNVFIHCQQGVSRSASMAVAYLMWTQRLRFEEAMAQVKQARGVADPNTGFICALLGFGTRIRGEDPFQIPRVYRMAPSFDAPVAKPVPLRGSSVADLIGSLDPRTAFVVHVPASFVEGGIEQCFVWQGAASKSEYASAASRWARHLQRYENAPVASEERHGDESEQFRRALGMSQESKVDVVARATYDKEYFPGHQAILEPERLATSDDEDDEIQVDADARHLTELVSS